MMIMNKMIKYMKQNYKRWWW